MVNGCPQLPDYTYTELRDPASYTSCLDYLLIDPLAMALDPSFLLLDLASALACSGHSHMVISFSVSAADPLADCGLPCRRFRWVPGGE